MDVATIVRNSALVGLMVWICVQDMRTRLVPSAAIVGIYAVQIAWIWLESGSTARAVQSSLQAIAASLAVLAIMLLACSIAFKLTGRDGLGGGDVRLLAALASVYGVWGVLRIMLGACLAAAVVQVVQRRGLGHAFAFCPYIAFGCLGAWMLSP